MKRYLSPSALRGWVKRTANPYGFVAGFIVSLVATFVVIPWITPKLRARMIVGKDLNKPNEPDIAEMGGIAVVTGFFAGASVLVAIAKPTNQNLLNVSFSAVLGAAFVGIMDDLLDLRQRQKAFLPFVLALPFGAAVDPHIVIPHVAQINLGAWMMIAAAFAVTCAANAANMLEGFNGLGAGLGIIMSFTLAILCLDHDRLDGMYLLIPLLGSLIAFLWFNKYPSQIFPGDTLMLFMGATIAAAALLSKLEVQTTVIFIPMIVEFALKLKGRFRAENYASRGANGHLEYHGKIESLTHVFMKYARVGERRLVAMIWCLEIGVCAVVIAVDLLM